MKCKVYLFDVDGVVVNSEYFTKKYENDFDVKQSEFDIFFNNEFLLCLTGKNDLKEAIEPWLKKWKWEESVDRFLTYWFEAENNLNLELISQIDKLKQESNKLYLATNQEKYRVDFLNNQMGLKKYFEKTYYSGLIGEIKPNKEFYKYIIDDLKINPTDIYFYDDCEKNIESAKSLGIKSFLYKEKMQIE